MPSPTLTPEETIRSMQARARYYFDVAEFCSVSGRPDDASLRQALLRLEKKGRIALATKRPAGWLIIPPEQMHYGAPPVTWWIDDCMRPRDPHYYTGLLSAARHWGSAHYAIQSTQIISSGRRSMIRVGQLRVSFFPKRNHQGTPTITVRDDVAPWRVSTQAATVLDLFRHQSIVGGLEAVARVTHDLAPSITADDLRIALNALDQTATAQRLGFVFETLGLSSLAKTVEVWLRSRRMSEQPLELQIGSNHTSWAVSERWRTSFIYERVKTLKELA